MGDRASYEAGTAIGRARLSPVHTSGAPITPSVGRWLQGEDNLVCARRGPAATILAEASSASATSRRHALNSAGLLPGVQPSLSAGPPRAHSRSSSMVAAMVGEHSRQERLLNESQGRGHDYLGGDVAWPA